MGASRDYSLDDGERNLYQATEAPSTSAMVATAS